MAIARVPDFWEDASSTRLERELVRVSEYARVCHTLEQRGHVAGRSLLQPRHTVILESAREMRVYLLSHALCSMHVRQGCLPSAHVRAGRAILLPWSSQGCDSARSCHWQCKID